MQVALQLKVIRGVRKNQIDGIRRQRIHALDAIAIQNLIERKRHRPGFLGLRLHFCLIPRHFLASWLCPKDESKVIRRQFLF